MDEQGNIVSDTDNIWLSEGFTDNPGSVIDGEIVDENQPSPGVARDSEKKRAAPPSRPAKAGPPNLDEWLDFFSRVVLRVACDWYVSHAFRGIDDSLITDREIERMKMGKEERDAIARPFAEFANKTPYLRKRGRLVIASADSIESIVTLGMWFSRVNRIAAKHRPKQRNARNERTRQATQSASTGNIDQPNGNGHYPGGITIVNPGSS